MDDKKEIALTGDCTPSIKSKFTIDLGAEIVERMRKVSERKRIVCAGPDSGATALMAENMHRTMVALCMASSRAVAAARRFGIQVIEAEEKFGRLDLSAVHKGLFRVDNNGDLEPMTTIHDYAFSIDDHTKIIEPLDRDGTTLPRHRRNVRNPINSNKNKRRKRRK